MGKATDFGFELTTTLEFPDLGPHELLSLADELDRAVFDETANFPEITEYFVIAERERSSILVGLRFTEAAERTMEQDVTDLLEGAFARLGREPRVARVAGDLRERRGGYLLAPR